MNVQHPETWSWSQVFITVPHGLCLPGVPRERHYCDFLAAEAAGRLYERLTSENVELFEASGVEEARVNVDLNRPVSRTTDFRTRLAAKTSKFVQSGDGNLLVLDVHSFPANTARGWRNYDLVILESWRESATPTTYARDLKEYLASKKLSVVGAFVKLDQQGSGLNDIYTTSLAHNTDKFRVGALLLEFNEGIGDGVLDDLVESIASWIKR